MINPDTGHKNRNTLYLACSGGGKSQVLYQNKAVPRRKVRWIAWDPNEDHPARRFNSLSAFKRMLAGELKRERGFRLAYTPKGAITVEEFEMFCQIVLAILDGDKDTYVIIEELAAVSPSAGQATHFFGILLNQGRKYGAQLHLTTQSGTEISKTAYKQCLTKYVGIQEGTDVDRMAKLCAVKTDQIKELQELEYLFKRVGKPPEKVKVNYVKPIHHVGRSKRKP